MSASFLLQGEVYSFGCNDDYALGRVTAEEEDSYIPGRVSVPNEIKVCILNCMWGNLTSIVFYMRSQLRLH